MDSASGTNAGKRLRFSTSPTETSQVLTSPTDAANASFKLYSATLPQAFKSLATHHFETLRKLQNARMKTKTTIGRLSKTDFIPRSLNVKIQLTVNPRTQERHTSESDALAKKMETTVKSFQQAATAIILDAEKLTLKSTEADLLTAFCTATYDNIRRCPRFFAAPRQSSSHF